MLRFLYSFCLLTLLARCTPDVVDVADFAVIPSKTMVKPGEALTFTFEGNPDIISFYSGENGKKYEFAGRTNATGGKPVLTFMSAGTNGTQANTLRLLVSSDFAGTFDSTSIQKATWTDLTSRANLSTGSSAASGAVDLTEFAQPNKPVYLAFRYVAPSSATSVQRTWTITSFSVNNVLPDGSTYPLATQADANWLGVNVKNTTNVWAVSASQLQIVGGALNAPDNDDWVITRLLDLTRVKPDLPVALKNMSTQPVPYTYAYATAGTYKATFVAANETIYGRKESVKEVTITVIP